jgi:hypothetical protein
MAVKVLYNRRYPKIYHSILRILGSIIYPSGEKFSRKVSAKQSHFSAVRLSDYINASSGISIALVSLSFIALS